eukprot:NODE_376_length_2328_cov_22.259882_g350_i0.p1 GENE.NODE_376_length_2328_cov_22.259882_g350_i0~~NODE_376_length_2328_cov_22.259882_g350_i0.p1  ORF type:complete len:755 (+),score=261.62 NODE_376_length_2328_cov_22.259882_g350_i0:57-2267(+)
MTKKQSKHNNRAESSDEELLRKKSKKSLASDSSSDVMPRKSTKKLPKNKKKKADYSSDEELLKRPAKVKTESKSKKASSKSDASRDRKTDNSQKADKAKSPKKSAPNENPEEEETVFKWWEQTDEEPKSHHWDTLEHNGVLFPPEYVPHHIPVLYKQNDGTLQRIPMEPDEEEVATMFAVMRESTKPPSDYYVNPVFRKNFFLDWLEILNSDPERNVRRFGTQQHPVRLLERVNFDDIWEWHQKGREEKKGMSREEKQKLKEQKDEMERPYKYCMWDGKKQTVGNFRIEPPGLFRGRGKHPLMGRLKKRVQPSDIIINIGVGAPVPKPPPGTHWKDVRHNNKVTWLAFWNESVNQGHKYVMLAADSMVKGKSDYKKFEKARNLGELIPSIRQQYQEDWYHPDEKVRQRAVGLYFIDFLALRCGNEKGEDEAETFGTCSLKCEHINLDKQNTIVFDFLGKDSIRYFNQVEVHPKVWSLCREFVKRKAPSSDLFDRLRPEQLNTHLAGLMPGLTAKVFRTFNASHTLDSEFSNNAMPPKLSVPEKIAYFNAANTKVAILCNHQKSQAKGHGRQMKTLEDKLAQLEALMQRLQKLKQDWKPSNKDKLQQQWEQQEKEQQLSWLDQYGTEEERAAYLSKLEASESKAKPSPSGSKATAKKPSVKKEESDSDLDLIKKRKRKRPKKESDSDLDLIKKRRHRVKKEESDSDLDLIKKRKKKRAKMQSDTSSDSDLKPKKRRK